MSFTIKKIYKVGRTNNTNKLRLMDNNSSSCTTCGGITGPDSSGSSSNLGYTSMQETDIYGDPLPIYVINWWVPDLESTVGSNIRRINGFVAPFPPIAYIDQAKTRAAFSYICWDGYNYSTNDGAFNCKCENNTIADAYGNCPSTQHNPPDDNNGGAFSTSFYPSGNILINQPGSYGIQLILDGYLPGCKPNELPKLIISYYKSITAMMPQNYEGYGVPPAATVVDDNCHWKLTVIQVTSPYNDKTYKTWWPTKDCSTVTPQPSTSTNADGTQSMNFNGLYTLEAGWILQFSLQNTCSPPGGSFTGTIQITPQFATYPSY
jgi:hypothetical protein